tara:strand:- start:888 stop:1076 length:189 start_codon:yes stop_codon:yes gene_type:complete
MITQSRFLKNLAYNKDMENEPMFKGCVDIKGKVYDGEIFREVQYGKEVLVLCLKIEEDDAPF